MAIVIGVVVALIIISILIYIAIRNGIIGARNRCDEAWSGIDVQLKRRHDLVPNLVETVKGYATHEREVFEKATKARAEAMQARGVADTGQKEAQLSGALTDLRAVAENYPTLRATENFQQLTGQLSELEDEIQASRRIYNSNVQAYNTKIQIFPNSVIANQGGFTPREYFEIEDAGDREPVAVSFSEKPAENPATSS
jgi:LemA protein